MGMMVAVFVLIFVVFLVLAFFGLIFEAASGLEWRPFVGMFLIATVVAVLGFVVGFVIPGWSHYFYKAALLIAVLSGAGVCFKLIKKIAKHFF